MWTFWQVTRLFSMAKSMGGGGLRSEILGLNFSNFLQKKISTSEKQKYGHCWSFGEFCGIQEYVSNSPMF